MNLVSCPSCGFALPPHARFCARCGVAQPAPAALPEEAPGFPGWVLVLFWLGAAVALLVAIVYAVVAASPGVAGPGGDDARVRLPAAVIALCSASLFVGQLAAAVGLTGARPWARVLATLVCVAWCLTCLGLPLGLLALNAIWRSRPAPAPANSPTLDR